ncbi:MAG: preprotein translocase subunit SecD [Haloferacaceae archaeon]
MNVRENWRVFLLLGVLLVSGFALFSPTLQGGDGPTNLQYGLQLSGGTRIRAPLAGNVATNADVSPGQETAIEQEVAANLDGATVTDVNAIADGTYSGNGQGTVEIATENVSQEQFAQALDAAGVSYDQIHSGVSDQSREETVRVLRRKINEAGLSGGTVQSITTATGEHFVVVEVPGENRQDVVDLVEERGTVRIDVFPVVRNGSTVKQRERAVLTTSDFRNIGTAQEYQQRPGAYVRVSIRDQAATQFEQQMVDTGVAQPGGSTCNTGDYRNSTDPCLLVVVNDRVVNTFGMTSNLAQSMRDGEWSQDPTFVLETRNISEAQQVSLNLRAGALPAKLDLTGEDRGTTSYVSPTQAESFKFDSLITGIIAVFAVAGVVFLRYGRPQVALPMIVTALSEVIILLGLAAAIGYPLDLSVIAGFIAVIGTGVDDLIIIADEVMAEGDVRSRRVFQSRFRKAFWVIGAAAATTIVAMSPLAILSLGDLKGFAIFTILGVIVGVLLTRPAYGDILRALLTRDR